jgi:hypothetical protein
MKGDRTNMRPETPEERSVWIWMKVSAIKREYPTISESMGVYLAKRALSDEQWIDGY